MKAGAASGPHATTYEHLSAEEHRLELERSREELRNVKKQLAERDTEILQLKTAHRKLQDTIRKKDKDLQNVFSVLRAPQDAELTKKRKTELVERLLMTTQQRVVNAEAVAEERKRELDKLKFSSQRNESKFLRYQELDIEIDECHHEIERLRSQLSQYTVVGKLKVSKQTSHAESSITQPKRVSQGSDNNQRDQQLHYREQIVTPIVPRHTVLSVTPAMAVNNPMRTSKREKFVERTRQRAVEAEYQKQIRLAQLEAECELEENLQILAKREAAAQIERRRQQSQRERQRSRTERVNATSVVVSAEDTKDDPTNAIEIETLAVKEEISSTPPIKIAAVTLVNPIDVSADVAVSVEQAVGDLVADVRAEESVPQQDCDPAAPTATETKEPKQYEDDGSDDGLEEVDDPAMPSERPIENDERKERNKSAHDDVDEVADEDSEGGDEKNMSVASDNPPAGVDEFEEDDVKNESREEGEEAGEEEAQREVAEVTEEAEDAGAAEPTDPIEDAVPEDELEEEKKALPVELKQGFRLDPVNNVEVPSSYTWPESATARTEEATDDLTITDSVEPTSAIANGVSEESVEDPEGKEHGIGYDKYEETNAQDEDEIKYEETEEGDDKGDEDTSPADTTVAIGPPTTESFADAKPAEDISVGRATADKISRQSSQPEGSDEETVEQTLHACDDAIVAASELIHRQIDSALAASTAATLTASETPPSDSTLAVDVNGLTPEELALVMDAAARKIQKFWRDMEVKYSASPQTQPNEDVDPVREDTSTVETVDETTVALGQEVLLVAETPEGVESPVVSEADATEEDGW